jgi:hypothetical protein
MSINVSARDLHTGKELTVHTKLMLSDKSQMYFIKGQEKHQNFGHET